MSNIFAKYFYVRLVRCYNTVMKFSELLKIFRERSSLSKTELAKKIRVTPSYIMNLESGYDRAPTAERLEQISRALNLTEAEKNELLNVAMQERIPKKELEILSGRQENKEPIVEIFNHTIPIVSGVGATDEVGRSAFLPYPHPYKVISFKGCKAVRVESDSMAPLAYKGQHIIYCEDDPVKDGDLVFIKLTNEAQLFKRYFKTDKHITLQSVNPLLATKPISIEEKNIEFCYKVVGIRF